MGFKLKSKETNQSNICNPFKVGGLIFDSEDDYQLFKNIDSNITQTVKSVEDGSIDLKEFFNNVKKINVIKKVIMMQWKKWNVWLKNATKLLCYEGTIFETDFKVGCFFDKINIIKYCDSDSDSDSD